MGREERDDVPASVEIGKGMFEFELCSIAAGRRSSKDGARRWQQARARARGYKRFDFILEVASWTWRAILSNAVSRKKSKEVGSRTESARVLLGQRRGKGRVSWFGQGYASLQLVRRVRGRPGKKVGRGGTGDSSLGDANCRVCVCGAPPSTASPRLR